MMTQPPCNMAVIAAHMTSTPLFLGLDGGQSSTTALIGDASGTILAKGIGGASNHVKAAEGRQRLIDAVLGAVGDAARQLGSDARQVAFEAACLGFTGGIADKEEVLRDLLRWGRLLVTDDVTIALSGAHENGTGIVTIAGTGSVAMARNARANSSGLSVSPVSDESSACPVTGSGFRADFRDCLAGMILLPNLGSSRPLPVYSSQLWPKHSRCHAWRRSWPRAWAEASFFTSRASCAYAWPPLLAGA